MVYHKEAHWDLLNIGTNFSPDYRIETINYELKKDIDIKHETIVIFYRYQRLRWAGQA